VVKRLIVPGLAGSGERHWQRWWLGQEPEAEIVEQDDFDRPNLADWTQNVGRQIHPHPGAVLVGHSLGAVLIAHLARQAFPIGAALIVAPVDIEANANLRAVAPDFAPIPAFRLPFPSIVVASTNDSLMSVERASQLARKWGSRFVHLGNSGHINTASGYGPWPGGLALAAQLVSSMPLPQLKAVQGAWRDARRLKRLSRPRPQMFSIR
jgi:uncharacterized protein